MTRPTKDVLSSIRRRDFIRTAGAGTVVTALGGGAYVMLGDDLTREARAQTLADGRQRLPPGQKVIAKLRPMGGVQGDPRPSKYRLRVHGEVEDELDIDFRELLAMPQTEQEADVHCVTGWSVLGTRWRGVRVADLARLARVKPSARHVIFEAAAGYTANVRLSEALAPSVMIAHRLDGRPLARPHGPPVRALVPDLYLWKSAKWLTGIRFTRRDQPGYWEVRGYNNHADPWLEERYA